MGALRWDVAPLLLKRLVSEVRTRPMLHHRYLPRETLSIRMKDGNSIHLRSESGSNLDMILVTPSRGLENRKRVRMNQRLDYQNRYRYLLIAKPKHLSFNAEIESQYNCDNSI